MWNQMMEENEGFKKQNSKKGFEKNQHACSMEDFFVVSDFTARQYLTLAGLTWTNQSSS